MNIDLLARSIGIILTPVVMVTNCSLLLNGILGRYAAINDRLRVLAHERLDLLRALRREPASDFDVERLQEIDQQIPDLLQRHQMLRNAVLVTYAAVAVFVASMFCLAAAVLSSIGWLNLIVLLVFLGGTLLMLVGVLITGLEVRGSQRAVQSEARRVLALGK